MTFRPGRREVGLHSAIRLRSVSRFIGAFHVLIVPSVALHFVEFTFLGGFESLPLRQILYLPYP